MGDRLDVFSGETFRLSPISIALNPGPGIAFATPEEKRVHDFQKILTQAGIPAFIRRPRGRDIYAACGQLKRTVA